MTTAARARDFVEKWGRVNINERAAAQEHFVDLCRLLGQPTPNEVDPHFYRFEKPLSKAGGGAGFADVWRDGCFVWEYKTRGKSLDLARQQILNYKGDLGNPPVMVLCDTARYELYIEFTGYKTRVERFNNDDLLNVSTRDLLSAALSDPQQLCPSEKTFTITEQIAGQFAQVAQLVERRGHAPHDVARFFMKLLFMMFAEDIGLLPDNLLSETLRKAIFNPGEFNDLIRPLFRTMRDGGYWGPGSKIPYFNGGLFADDDAIPLTVDDVHLLHTAAQQDWSSIEPAIFGTLFERSLEPSKRAQLGAHYTGRDDIVLLVEPVLMAPLRAEWEATRLEIELLRPAYDHAHGVLKQRLRNQIEGQLFTLSERLADTTVLDAACGSGNFLYIALHALKDLEKEVITYAIGIGVTAPAQSVGPQQLYGMEINPFAAQLAQVVVWIGELQWNRKNGFPNDRRPVLQSLQNIVCADALMDHDQQTGQPTEQQWPTADVIVGNPPFLGGKRMRRELKDAYVERLRNLYAGRLANDADLVTYWFEKARAQVELRKTKRVGLIATNSIRYGANRKVLERVKQTGDVFYAWSDRPWVLDGAAVRVSMVGFDGGSEQQRTLDGKPVVAINPDLSATANVTNAVQLPEDAGLSFLGMMKGGPFDIDATTAHEMLLAPLNSNGRPNSDVVKRRLGGQDITGRPRNGWVIDFEELPLEKAAVYAVPFAYVQRVVKPVRDTVRDQRMRTKWWLHGRSRQELRRAIKYLHRCIVTPEVAKHRLFVWMPTDTIPDHTCHVIAREDDYFFGVLHSRVHEKWSLAVGNYMGMGNDPRYNSAVTFQTFPFPWAPSHEPQDDPRVHTIADAARTLVALRDEWLNPPSLFGDGAGMKDRTLTNLYNKHPDWLDEAHHTLDAAVLAAYGWPIDLSDGELLERLLALNMARAAQAS